MIPMPMKCFFLNCFLVTSRPFWRGKCQRNDNKKAVTKDTIAQISDFKDPGLSSQGPRMRPACILQQKLERNSLRFPLDCCCLLPQSRWSAWKEWARSAEQAKPETVEPHEATLEKHWKSSQTGNWMKIPKVCLACGSHSAIQLPQTKIHPTGTGLVLLWIQKTLESSRSGHVATLCGDAPGILWLLQAAQLPSTMSQFPRRHDEISIWSSAKIFINFVRGSQAIHNKLKWYHQQWEQYAGDKTHLAVL